MTKTKRNDVGSVADSFHRHYAGIWSEERWQTSLYPALLRPTRYACVLNRYASCEDVERKLRASTADLEALPLPHGDEQNPHRRPKCLIVKTQEKSGAEQGDESTQTEEATFPAPEVTSNGLLSHWNLDAASVLVASLLNIKPGDKVLDLCAAPGGKSISLSQALWPHLHADRSSPEESTSSKTPVKTGVLHSNEADGRRQRRLVDNLKAYLPRVLFESGQITALRVDGTSPKAEYELRVKTSSGAVSYDKVLVDAPCSSERHIIHAHAKASTSGRVAEEMSSWRVGSSKRLSKMQIDLLITGLKVVRTGGVVMYATCSIEPTENDGVVEKVLAQIEKERRKGGRWTVKVGFDAGDGTATLEKEIESMWAERTKFGWIVLPDHPSCHRWGPLFFAVLTKVPA
ncbi:uncharacterized protein PV09_01554 [Verruconis gallopava]|uniref:NOL1/NOP2/Sun domain family member 4 n=1 Tax=Verruconis gallopava TaxID=253628 RepID=A0A0D2B8N1_9PEZI|nr:uncharacterized protein PV09_01554 [Verruconis gallopava]KIW07604.1 hypothetical protein PV09_01554 [Verruconis gallopava]